MLVYLCLPLFTKFTYFYPCLLVFTYVYPCTLVFTPCTLVFTYVYSSLLMFTRVYLCLFVFTYIYSCLPMFNFVYLCLFTYIYPCLLVFTYVYSSVHMWPNIGKPSLSQHFSVLSYVHRHVARNFSSILVFVSCSYEHPIKRYKWKCKQNFWRLVLGIIHF